MDKDSRPSLTQRSLRRLWAYAPALVLLLIHAGLGLSASRTKCTTYDEIAHVTAGCSYWLDDDYRLHPENGNLPQRWATLPLLADRPHFPSHEQPAWEHGEIWTLGQQFFYQLGNDCDGMLLRARAMIALFSMALGLLVYGWSTRLFGRGGGLLSVILYAFCPTTLTHGFLATSDMAAALFFTASMGSLWVVLHRVTPLTLLGSALLLAGLFLAKMSAVMIVPMGLVLLVVRLFNSAPVEVRLGRSWQVVGRRRWLLFAGVVAVQVLLVAGAIWAAFGFRYAVTSAGAEGESPFRHTWPRLLETPGRVTSAVRVARDYHLLPEAYLHGFQFTWTFAQGRNAFLNGDFRAGGWAHFFPYCLLVKTPLSLFLLLLLAALAMRRHSAVASGEGQWRRLGDGLYRAAPLWVLLIVYWAFAVTSKLNIGQRHLLPTYPAMFILAGAAVYWLRPRPTEAGSSRRNAFRLASPVAGSLTVLAVVLFIAESLATWPHYLSYFNQVVGGPKNGYKHLVDSSLDWGQDLPALKRWLDQRGLNDPSGPVVYLGYFGTGSPEYYGIHAIPLERPEDSAKGNQPPEDLKPGIYCLSATVLQGVYLHPPGPWQVRSEEFYLDTLNLVQQYRETADDPAAREQLLRGRGMTSWSQAFAIVESIRLARLCAFLRQRPPREQVTPSLLIYDVSEADLERALNGPPPYPKRPR